MASSFEKLMADIEEISHLEVFWDRIMHELSRFGVTSIMYGVIATKAELLFGARTESMIWKTNHNSKFFERFGQPGRDDSIDNCLTYEHTLRHTSPFIWHHLHMWEDATPKQMAHALAAKELGLFVGFTLSTTHFGEERFGAISVSAGNHTAEGFDIMWAKDKDELLKVLQILDYEIREKYISEMVKLSPREKETLEWLAAGVRPSQIAEKMKIGFRTVDKYINNAKRKLKAKSRDQAIAKALIFKIIAP